MSSFARVRPVLLLVLLMLLQSRAALRGETVDRARGGATGDGTGEESVSGLEAKYLFTVAQELRHEADYEGARAAFEAALAADSDEPYLRISYAEFLYQLGDLEAAAVQAGRVDGVGAAQTDALRLLARIRLRQAHESSEAVEDAIRLFQRLRALLPLDIESRVSVGRLLMSQGRFDEAVSALREAYDLSPGDLRLASMLMAAFQGSEDHELVEKGLRDLLETYPELLDARLALANLLAEAQRHGDSVEVLEAVVPEQGSDVDLLRLSALELYRVGAWEESLEASERWLEAAPGEAPAVYLRGLALSAMGRFPEAEADLRGLYESDKGALDVARVLSEVVERQGRALEAADILVGVARQLEEQGEAELAFRTRLELVDLEVRAQNWQRVIELTEELSESKQLSERGELELLRGQALLESGRYDDAITAFNALGDDQSVSSRARAREAEALFHTGATEVAETKLLQLAEAGDLDQVVLVAQTLHRLELYERAIPLWLEAKQENPDALDVRFWLGSAYERSGRRKTAIREFQDLLSRDDLFAPALNYLGYMWAEQGENLSEAADLVKKAVALEPNNGAYADSLGWVYYQLGEYDEALGHLEKAAELVGDDSVVLEHLGDLYLALGKRSMAAQSYERAMALAEDNESAVREKLDRLAGPQLNGDS